MPKWHVRVTMPSKGNKELLNKFVIVPYSGLRLSTLYGILHRVLLHIYSYIP